MRVFVLVHEYIYVSVLKINLFHVTLLGKSLWEWHTWECGCEKTPAFPKQVKKINCFEGQKAIYPGFIVNINKGMCILHKM